jgi:hypothetical protein
MHIFISDVHMTDAGLGGAVTDAQLVSFVEHALGIARGKKVQLVLVGDIFDLLRSSKWTRLWEEKRSAPWNGMAEGFKNFKGSHAETQAIEIAKASAARYAGFSAILRRAIDAKMIEPRYVPRNHGFMFQLSPELRKVLVDFLGLSHDPKKAFNMTYQDKPASVFATHGNAIDVVNWHRQTDGYWALGDAVVLRIVNRFPEEVCREIGGDLRESSNSSRCSRRMQGFPWRCGHVACRIPHRRGRELCPGDRSRVDGNSRGDKHQGDFVATC